MLHHYPSISEDEFAEACKTLEQKCHDNFDGTNWLSARWYDGQLEIKQTNAVQTTAVSDVVAGDHQSGHTTLVEKDDEKTLDGDNDEDSIIRHTPASQQDRPAVDFSIVLSPTYRVPVLWFSLAHSRVAPPGNLEEVYSRVVNAGSHQSLRGIGIMGGISLANHPVTDKPSFFIHPCNTPGAMITLNDGSDLDAFQYLMLWFGIVGASVGLHVPSKVASRP